MKLLLIISWIAVLQCNPQSGYLPPREKMDQSGIAGSQISSQSSTGEFSGYPSGPERTSSQSSSGQSSGYPSGPQKPPTQSSSGQFSGYPSGAELTSSQSSSGLSSGYPSGPQKLPTQSSSGQFSGYPSGPEQMSSQSLSGQSSGYSSGPQKALTQSSSGQFSGYPSGPEQTSSQSSSDQSFGYPSGPQKPPTQSSSGQFSGYPAGPKRMDQRGFAGPQTSSGRVNYSEYSPQTQEVGQNDVARPTGFKPMGQVGDNGPSEGSINTQGTTIHRHIYFHTAPPEPETPSKQLQQMSSGVRRKHYTILFIDTSRLAGPNRQQQQAAAAQNEEKTIVYVLVKKPNEQAESNALTGTSKPPNKPEVFFIKYKEQRESKSKAPTTEVNQKEQGNGGAPYPPKLDSMPKVNLKTHGGGAPYPPKMEAGLKHKRNTY